MAITTDAQLAAFQTAKAGIRDAYGTTANFVIVRLDNGMTYALPDTPLLVNCAENDAMLSALGIRAS